MNLTDEDREDLEEAADEWEREQGYIDDDDDYVRVEPDGQGEGQHQDGPEYSSGKDMNSDENMNDEDDDEGYDDEDENENLEKEPVLQNQICGIESEMADLGTDAMDMDQAWRRYQELYLFGIDYFLSVEQFNESINRVYIFHQPIAYKDEITTLINFLAHFLASYLPIIGEYRMENGGPRKISLNVRDFWKDQVMLLLWRMRTILPGLFEIPKVTQILVIVMEVVAKMSGMIACFTCSATP